MDMAHLFIHLSVDRHGSFLEEEYHVKREAETRVTQLRVKGG